MPKEPQQSETPTPREWIGDLELWQAFLDWNRRQCPYQPVNIGCEYSVAQALCRMIGERDKRECAELRERLKAAEGLIEEATAYSHKDRCEVCYGAGCIGIPGAQCSSCDGSGKNRLALAFKWIRWEKSQPVNVWSTKENIAQWYVQDSYWLVKRSAWRNAVKRASSAESALSIALKERDEARENALEEAAQICDKVAAGAKNVPHRSATQVVWTCEDIAKAIRAAKRGIESEDAGGSGVKGSGDEEAVRLEELRYVWAVENKTSFILFASEEDAQHYVAQQGASVGGGMAIAKLPVCRSLPLAPLAPEVQEAVELAKIVLADDALYWKSPEAKIARALLKVVGQEG